MSKQRQLVYAGTKPPAAIEALLKDEGVCRMVSQSWPALRAILVEIQCDLAGFTAESSLQSGPVVLAANKILKTFQVFHEQALSDKAFYEQQQHEKDTTK